MIVPNVFSQEYPDLQFLVSRNMNLRSSLTFHHTWCTAPASINQPVCEGGDALVQIHCWGRSRFLAY